MTTMTEPVDKLEQARKDLDQFFGEFKTVILSTVSSQGKPDSSYAPSVVDEDKNFYVYVSALAKHTANLKKAGTTSLMIIEDESKAESLFARRRLTLTCSVEAVERDSEHFNKMLDTFTDKFGDTVSGLRDMIDFTLFKLTPEKGRMVTGFGAAFHVTGTEIERHMGGSGGRGHIRKSDQKS